MITAGIDAGSRSIKVVLIESDPPRILGRGLTDQAVHQVRLAESLFHQVLDQARLDPARVAAIVATGYGRNAIPFATTTITEITCHARGVRHLLPDTRTLIEIGGQDSKIIRFDRDGRVRDFAMNDRCAAGTGRFLEVVAARLELRLADLGPLARHSRQPAAISNTCVVFAETEIIGLLAAGTQPPDIAAGIQAALATRIAALAARHVEPPVAFTGGVALLSGVREALETTLGCSIRIPADPQYTGALGAALLAGGYAVRNQAARVEEATDGTRETHRDPGGATGSDAARAL